MKWNWEIMTPEEKDKAVKEELRLYTHNAATKTDMINMLRWVIAERTCEWEYDSQDEKWDSECGAAWVFTANGPIENDMKYCPVCGKLLVEITEVEG